MSFTHFFALTASSFPWCLCLVPAAFKDICVTSLIKANRFAKASKFTFLDSIILLVKGRSEKSAPRTPDEFPKECSQNPR